MKIYKEYYIPTVDEFRVGFLHEHQDHKGIVLGFHPSDWIEEQVEKFMTDLYAKKIKVKYLYEDDFKELSWKKYGKAPKGILYKGYVNERREEVRMIYTPQSKHVLIYVINVPFHEQTVFAGKVQNISELKVIIKQLNIKPI